MSIDFGNDIYEDPIVAKTFLAEIKAGSPVLLAKRKALGDHPAEITGKKIRSLFERKG